MPLIIPANTLASGGYEVDNSLRFNDGDDPRLKIANPTAGVRTKGTFSTWFKRCTSGAVQFFFSTWNNATDGYSSAMIYLNSDKLHFNNYLTSGASAHTNLVLPRLFRDSSAWSHIVCAWDTTLGTSTDRVKIYVNGVRETNFEGTVVFPAEDEELFFQIGGTANPQHIGYKSDGGGNNFDGYLAETVYVEGTALAADQFGEFDSDSNIWKPIDVSGLTFGDEGFYLDFENSGALGADVSGNSNNFTVSNLTAIDQTTDTCTNNFITLNPLIGYTSNTDNQVYSEGNTIIIPNSTDNYGTGSSTIGLKGGKWYWEAQIVWNGTSNNANFPRTIGFVTEDYGFNYSYLGQDSESWGVYFNDESTDIWGKSHSNSAVNITGATTMANGGTMNLALDLDNGKFYVGYNGTFFTSGDPTSGATGTGAIYTLTATDLSKYIFPAVTNATNSTYYKFNFGNPAYAISSGNTDGNDRGNFEYAVPSGYYSLNTKNLAEYG